MNTQPLTVEQVEQFQRDGYLFVENLLDAEETKLLCQAAKLDSTTQDAAMGVKDT